MELIDWNALIDKLDGIWDCNDMVFEPDDCCDIISDCKSCKWRETKEAIKRIVLHMPTIDAVPVVRCKDCVYYHKAHVKLDDGTELDYDSDVVKEYQQKRKESGDPFWEMVCADLGINVGGRCERDNNQGYAEDKAVFRSETDFCSKARAKMEVQE